MLFFIHIRYRGNCLEYFRSFCLTRRERYSIISSVDNGTRKWRNRQTRTFEGRVDHSVRVQVPSSAPQKCETVDTIGFALLFFLTEKPCKTKSSGNRGLKTTSLLPELFCFPGKFIYFYDFQMNPLPRNNMIVRGKI